MDRHLLRYRWVYEQKQSGRTYVDIARELNLSPSRIRQLAKRWERYLVKQARYNQEVQEVRQLEKIADIVTLFFHRNDVFIDAPIDLINELKTAINNWKPDAIPD